MTPRSEHENVHDSQMLKIAVLPRSLPDAQMRLLNHGSVDHVRPQRALCSFDGCGNTNKGHGLCALHLRRKKRGLPLDYSKPQLSPRRYRFKKAPNHPLCDKLGRVYAHRQVLFDTVEGSRLPCFWCGSPLNWMVDLVVDHLNHNRHDNSSRNLVPACNGCNAGRTIRNPRIRQSIYFEGVGE